MKRWFWTPALACLLVSCDIDGDGLTRKEENEIGTDPRVADTDGDGVNDGDEVAAGTDPLAKDDFVPTGGHWVTQKPTVETNTCNLLATADREMFITTGETGQFALEVEVPWFPDGSVTRQVSCTLTGYAFTCEPYTEKVMDVDDRSYFGEYSFEGSFTNESTGEMTLIFVYSCNGPECESFLPCTTHLQAPIRLKE